MKMNGKEIFTDSGEYIGIYSPVQNSVNVMEKFDSEKQVVLDFAASAYKAPVYIEREKTAIEKWFEKEYGDEGLES